MTDGKQRSEKRNLYFIGGSPCSGKSTVAEQLAKECGLYWFQADDSLGRCAARGAALGYDACSRQWKGSPDEIWLRDVRQQCRDELQFYREIGGFMWEELQGGSQGTSEDGTVIPAGGAGILAEGAVFLPELMKAWGIPPDHYVCIIPSAEFQISHYRKRDWVPLMLEGCSDKEKAFDNWMERDILFAEQVRRQCEEAGYRSLVADGSLSAEEMKEQVRSVLGI